MESDSGTGETGVVAKSWRPRPVVALAAAVLVALAAAGTALAYAVPAAGSDANGSAGALAESCAASAPKLTVEGTGLATATPDLLTISVGIDVTDPTAQASLADDNSKAAEVTAALKQGGVLDKDVQTTDLTIQPDYNYKGAITGYDVSNTLTANLQDFSSAGSIIDALAAAAGNAVRIDSLTFSVQDPRAMEDQARDQAVHQAVSHARAMAAAAGERLGPVCSLSDTTPVVPVGETYPSAGLAAQSAAASTVPLQPGSQQAQADVQMVYALEPTGTSR